VPFATSGLGLRRKSRFTSPSTLKYTINLNRASQDKLSPVGQYPASNTSNDTQGTQDLAISVYCTPASPPFHAQTPISPQLPPSRDSPECRVALKMRVGKWENSRKFGQHGQAEARERIDSEKNLAKHQQQSCRRRDNTE
jgi:hypothetical protein